MFLLVIDNVKKPKGITHKVLECVHRLGDVEDPLTGKAVVADRYRDEVITSNDNIPGNGRIMV